MKSQTNYDNCTSYVDFRMREWGMDEQPHRIQTIVSRVLNELEPWALIFLKDPRFQASFVPEDGFSLKRKTHIVMLLSTARFKRQLVKRSEAELREDLGYVLLYLHAPKAMKWNDRRAAIKEWRRCVQRPVAVRRPARSPRAASPVNAKSGLKPVSLRRTHVQ